MPFNTVDLTQHIGTEVFCPVDTLLQPETGRALRHLLTQRGVLLLREANLSNEQQLTLASHMGRVRPEGDGGILKITLDKQINAKGDYLKGSFLWHMDGTHDSVPVFGSLLSGRRLSQVGGQTEFANSYAAYSALPQAMKDKIADLKVVHSVATSMRRAGVEPTAANMTYWQSIPDRTHKLVWQHACGRKSLVIGCHASHVEGWSQNDSDALLEELLAFVTQPKFVYRHEWSVGDCLIWDNTGVLHRAEPYPIDSGRLMDRATLLGEEAFS